ARGEAALAAARAAGAPAVEAFALRALGEALYRLGDRAAAGARYEEALGVFRRQDDAWGAALALDGLGLLALDRGDAPAARAPFRGSLALLGPGGTPGVPARGGGTPG